MKIRSLWLGMAIALAGLCLAPSVRAAQPSVRAGRGYYMRYCASCHGINGDGHGPIASEMVKPPANLRLLGDKYGMPLPAARLAELIEGLNAPRAHGYRDMPVWGVRLYEMGHGKREISRTIRDIVDYLDTIQNHRTAAR